MLKRSWVRNWKLYEEELFDNGNQYHTKKKKSWDEIQKEKIKQDNKKKWQKKRRKSKDESNNK